MSQVEYCAITTGEHDALLLVRAWTWPKCVMDEVIRRPYLLPSSTTLPVLLGG
jgi:hypothetical protein